MFEQTQNLLILFGRMPASRGHTGRTHLTWLARSVMPSELVQERVYSLHRPFLPSLFDESRHDGIDTIPSTCTHVVYTLERDTWPRGRSYEYGRKEKFPSEFPKEIKKVYAYLLY